jgi:signal transduction histidine kinase
MEKEEVISIFLQVTIIAFILIIAFIVLIIFIRFKRNTDIRQKETMQSDFATQLLQSQIEVQEQTFQQIGKELHDNVGQLLSTSRMLIGLAERSLDNPPDTLLIANVTLGQAITELRSLSKSLDKEWLEQFNFNENLQTEIERINASEKVKASYHQEQEILLKPDEQTILFRIVQEAIQNAIKHANPTHIGITTEKEENKLHIRITDDGTGFEINAKGNGLGLNNMKHRTTLLGGTIVWEAVPEKGTTVVINLPFKEDSR